MGRVQRPAAPALPARLARHMACRSARCGASVMPQDARPLQGVGIIVLPHSCQIEILLGASLHLRWPPAWNAPLPTQLC